MTFRSLCLATLTSVFAAGLLGCPQPPGKPAGDSVATTPDQVLDFPTLYAGNCAACHGTQGSNGAAMSLANPVYLATAGTANIQSTISHGVHGTMMPPFAIAAGGTLTDRQIVVLAQGLITHWGKVSALEGQTPLSYASHTVGDPHEGEKVFTDGCARCHGAQGKGLAAQHTGSLVDPAYLALISNQGLRSIILAGRPDQGMPDWRHDLTAATLSDQQVTDTVAWLGTFRATSSESHP